MCSSTHMKAWSKWCCLQDKLMLQLAHCKRFVCPFFLHPLWASFSYYSIIPLFNNNLATRWLAFSKVFPFYSNHCYAGYAKAIFPSLQLICGGLAGSTAALFTTPFDVVKTRLQTQVRNLFVEISRSPFMQFFATIGTPFCKSCTGALSMLLLWSSFLRWLRSWINVFSGLIRLEWVFSRS